MVRLRFPRAVWLFLGLTVLAAGVLLARALIAWPETIVVSRQLLALLFVLAVVAQHFPVEIAPGYKINAASAVYFAAMLVAGTSVALLLTVAGQLVGGGTLALRRNPVTGRQRRGLPAVLFNAAQLVLAIGLGGLVYGLLVPPPPAQLDDPANAWAVPAAALVVYLVSTGLVACMAGLQRGQSPLAVWRAAQRLEVPEGVGLVTMGWALALLSEHYPWAPLLLIPPAALLHWSLSRTHRLHQEATRAAAELRAVLESIEQGVLMTDREGYIRFGNRRLGELLGLDTGQLIGRHKLAVAQDLLAPRLRHPELVLKHLAWSDKHPAEATIHEVQLTGPVPRILARYSGPVRSDPGDPAGLIAGRIEVYRDVTEARQLELAKETFLASAGHELKTPLTTLSGYLDLIEAQLTGPRPLDQARLIRYLTPLRGEMERLLRLSDDLLMVTGLQVGRLTIRPAPLDLAVLVSEEAARFAAPPNVAARGHRFVCRASGPLIGAYDRLRLGQVLTNLLENAAKYSPAGGAVTISAEQAGTEALISVRDQGIGIPPENRDKLFLPFYRAENASYGSPEGLGLGLYISRAIVEAHGGRIWVESAPPGEQGSIFRIALPLGDEFPV
jgi:signal transduction histidine kinase